MEIIGGIIGSIGVVCIAIKGGLAALGFSSIGPVAGTVAASMQAGIGNVAAGSIFAIAQSVAMGGLSIIFAPVAAVCSIIGSIFFFGKLF